MTKQPRLDYAPRKDPAPARPTAMFFLILPGTIWAIFILFIRVQEAIWRGPVGAFGFAAWSLLLLPTALICLIIAAVQAFRKKKFAVALLIGLGWNLLFLAVFWVFIYFIPKN